MPPATAWLTTDFSPGIYPLQPGGCGWYRSFLPMRAVSELGFETGMGIPDYNIEKGFGLAVNRTKTICGWEVVVLKLLMNRETPHQVEQSRKHQVVVVDVDDFYAGLTEDNQAFQVTDPARNPERNRDHYERVIEAADHVTVSTQFLFDWYSARRPNVHLIRNGIDLGRWSRRKDTAGEHPTIGWVGGLPWRSGDIEELRPWLRDFLDEHGLKFHHAGHVDRGAPFHVKAGIDPARVTTEGMAAIVDYPRLFGRFDIGLVPLRDIPFNHAKSTIKGMEYAASGIPFVAAATPEYVRLAEMGVGRVARTPEEWTAHLTELLDPRVRRKEAARNRALLSQAHTMLDRGREWADVLAGVTQAGG